MTWTVISTDANGRSEALFDSIEDARGWILAESLDGTATRILQLIGPDGAGRDVDICGFPATPLADEDAYCIGPDGHDGWHSVNPGHWSDTPSDATGP